MFINSFPSCAIVTNRNVIYFLRSHRLLITHAERYQIPDLLDGAFLATICFGEYWRASMSSRYRAAEALLYSHHRSREAREMISPIDPAICRGANLTISSNVSMSEQGYELQIQSRSHDRKYRSTEGKSSVIPHIHLFTRL